MLKSSECINSVSLDHMFCNINPILYRYSIKIGTFKDNRVIGKLPRRISLCAQVYRYCRKVYYVLTTTYLSTLSYDLLWKITLGLLNNTLLGLMHLRLQPSKVKAETYFKTPSQPHVALSKHTKGSLHWLLTEQDSPYRSVKGNTANTCIIYYIIV